MLGPALSPAALAAVEQALAFVAAAAPFRRNVSDRQWEELVHVSLLLATFEAVYRSRLPPAAFADLASPPRDWREWAALVCVEVEVEDVAILGWAARQDHAELQGRDHTCNPTFAQSHALGGADADLITDSGILIEFKSTSTTRTCSSIDLWQLCGYALADTDDQHEIAAVGLFALRWRTQTVWPLAYLLKALAGQRVDIADMRRRYAQLLAGERDRRCRVRNERARRAASTTAA